MRPAHYATCLARLDIQESTWDQNRLVYAMTIILFLGGLAVVAGWFLVRCRRLRPEATDLDHRGGSGESNADSKEISVCRYSAQDPLYGTRIRSAIRPKD